MTIRLSRDQENIVNYEGRGLKVLAGAGAGKTFVLKHRVLKRPEHRMLYLAYNKAIKDEALESFPSNCTCKTFHGLAYSLVGRDLKHKLVSNLQLDHVREFVSDFSLASTVLSVVQAYAISELKSIDVSLLTEAFRKENSVEKVNDILKLANLVWNEMVDPSSDMKITHDTYFKLLALSPGLVVGFDEILVDEAQDANGAKIQLIQGLQQYSNIVLVGDSAQQINAWNGAVDAFKHPCFNDFDVLTLSQSYRFGEAIAIISNIILAHKKGKDKLVVKGMPRPSCIYSQLPQHLGGEHIAIISRTTSGCIEQGVEASLKGERVYWVGGIDSYGISDLVDVGHLKSGNNHLVKNKDLQRFKNYKEFCLKAEIEEIQSYLKLIKLADQFGARKNIKDVLKKNSVDDESISDISITTAHKAKGMDWPIVLINDDFGSIITPRDKDDLESYYDELNLWYVTVTRAKQCLVYGNSALSELFHDVGMSYFYGFR